MQDVCPICGCRPTPITTGHHHVIVDCIRCGYFGLAGQAFDLPAKWIAGAHPGRAPRGRFAASHAIRRMQTGGDRIPEIDEGRLRTLWAQPIPNPQRQADLLILALGDAGLPLDEFVRWRAERFCAEIGTEDDPRQGRTGALSIVLERLSSRQLIERERHTPAPDLGCRLTFDGWAAYEHLRRDVVESKTVFMAMSFNNPTLSKLVADIFVPAVRETGFELYRLDDRPKSGIIDNRMRVEIRAAKFLVCDLTDENRGAYWEAGFADGAGKPVFYTCETSKFDKAKTHFDTEHLFTVKWDPANPGGAAEDLKAAIRNEFPTDSLPPDLSRGR